MLANNQAHLLQHLVRHGAAQLACVDDHPFAVGAMMYPESILRTDLVCTTIDVKRDIEEIVDFPTIPVVDDVVGTSKHYDLEIFEIWMGKECVFALAQFFVEPVGGFTGCCVHGRYYTHLGQEHTLFEIHGARKCCLLREYYVVELLVFVPGVTLFPDWIIGVVTFDSVKIHW